MDSKQPETQDIIRIAGELRSNLDIEEKKVRAFVETIKIAETKEGFNQGECIAQAMLALRHIEDSRMRIGKVIQYSEGGTSIYDKK